MRRRSDTKEMGICEKCNVTIFCVDCDTTTACWKEVCANWV